MTATTHESKEDGTMRKFLAMLGVLALAAPVLAGGPPTGSLAQPEAVPCNLTCICYDWDFAVSNQGFTAPNSCDTGGTPTWQYGNTTLVPAPGTVWGTTLNANYPINSGDALKSPAFTVTSNCNMVEIYHYIYTESSYDGGNVKCNDTLITPMGGYTGTICTSTSYYAFCVDMEMGWMGQVTTAFRADCFDLSQFMGQTVVLSFEFGSDSSVTYPGWYVASVKVGGTGATPTEDSTWGQIKNLFQ